MARSIRGAVRVDGLVLGMSVGVPSNELRARLLYAFLVVQYKSVRARGGAVSEATATAESVVVEAFLMSNSLCEAMGESSRRTGSKKKKGASEKSLRPSKSPIWGGEKKKSKMRSYRNERQPR